MKNQANDNKAPSANKSLIVITVKLLAISMITALLLSCVNALTLEKIADNAKREKAAAIEEIFPDADSNIQLDVTLDGTSALYKVYSGDSVIGYVAEATPLGFGGEMTLMVGVNKDGTVSGVKLVSHSETPGLGDRTKDPTYLKQYVGMGNDTINVSEIDVITGSTISSKAILEGVNNALSAYGIVFSEMSEGGAE